MARMARMAGLALSLALLAMSIMAPAGAPAQGANPRPGACPSAGKHIRRGVRATGHCVKRSKRHHKAVSHRPRKHARPGKKGAGRRPSVPARVPALCEDASAPLRSEGEFSCEDGSEPSCEDGSEPTADPSGGVPLCPAVGDPASPLPDEPCEAEATGECHSVEWSCEASFDASEASVACEEGGGEEATF